MSICGGSRLALALSLARAGARFGIRLGVPFGLAALFLFGANDALQTAFAEGDTRTLSFHHLHTDETITVTFKRNGRYDEAALKQLDWFMRDWRKEESVQMDPHLFDLLWQVYREVDGKEPIQVICGYRAAGTNAMLRARSSGVAQNSNHISGQAIDFEIPAVSLEKIREVGLRLQHGGVGFYPTSGSPVVHMDTGTIRHWPRMTREQLVKVFPDGRTVHVPADGKPLPGYALALSDVERNGKEPNGVSLAAARDAGIDVASIEQTAGKPERGLLARLFGGNQVDDENEPNDSPAPKRARAPVAVASLSAAPKRVAVERVVPLPAARPRPIAVAINASPAPGNVFDNRGIWRSPIESSDLPPLPDAKSAESEPANALANADPVTTGSIGNALAYAAETPLPKPARTRPMGAQLPQLPATASVMPPSSGTAVAFAPSLTSDGQRADSPWLRAAMLTPNVSDFMTATTLGTPHILPLTGLLHKPQRSVLMTFSADPHLGIVADRFSGRAVVFLATATFTTQTTASLQ